MKELPLDPLALQARMMAAIIGDILEPGATTFARLDALREVSKLEQAGPVAAKLNRESTRDGGSANNAPPTDQ